METQMGISNQERKNSKMNRLKKAGNTLLTKTAAAVSTAIFTAQEFIVTARADTDLDDIDVKDNGSEIMTNTINVLGTLTRYVGAFLLVVGLIMLFMGFKNEDAEAKHRAGLVIVAGIGLVAIKTIISTVTGLGSDS